MMKKNKKLLSALLAVMLLVNVVYVPNVYAEKETETVSDDEIDATSVDENTADTNGEDGDEICTCNTTTETHEQSCSLYVPLQKTRQSTIPEIAKFEDYMADDPALVPEREYLPYDEIVAWYEAKKVLETKHYDYTESASDSKINSLYSAAVALDDALGVNWLWYPDVSMNTEQGYIVTELNMRLQNVVNIFMEASKAAENAGTTVEAVSPDAYARYMTLKEYWSYDEKTPLATAVETPEIEVHLFNYGNKINEYGDTYYQNNYYYGFPGFIRSLHSLHFHSQKSVDELESLNFPDGCTFDEQQYAIVGTLSNGYPTIGRWFKLGSTATTDYSFDSKWEYRDGWGNFKYDPGLWASDHWADVNPEKKFHGNNWTYLFDKNLDAETKPAIALSDYAIAHYPVESLKLFEVDDNGYYTYDSRINAAEYDYDTQSLTAYNHALRSSSVSRYASSQGSFLPFNSINTGNDSSLPNVTLLQDENGYKSYHYSKDSWNNVDYILPIGMFPTAYPKELSTLTNFEQYNYDIVDGEYYFCNYDWNETETDFTDDDYAKAVRRLAANLYKVPGQVKNLYALNPVEDNALDNDKNDKVDLAFGMSMEFDFQMPASKQVNGKDIVYEFTGDDDLLVYVDGVCLLNLSGHHQAIKGQINFTSGQITVYEDGSDQAISLARGSTGRYAYRINPGNWEWYDQSGWVALELGDLLDTNTFYNPNTVHEVKIFYLERTGGAANCSMKFNIPAIEKGTVTVEKKEEGLSSTGITAGTTAYDFKLVDNNNSALINESYQVYKNGTYVRSGATDANGLFQLKGGEKAEFVNLTVGKNVKVLEVPADDATYQTTCTVNNSVTGTTDSGPITVSKDTAQEVIFTNNYTVTYGSLQITKEGINPLDTHAVNGDNPAEHQNTIYHIADSTGKVSLDVTIEGNNSVTINNLPTGEYTVTEQMDWAWRYTNTSSTKDIKIEEDKTAQLTFTNTRSVSKWLSGDYYKKNLFKQ